MSELATLTAEDWKALHAEPAALKKEDAGTPTQIADMLANGPIVRTDADGRYSITEEAAERH